MFLNYRDSVKPNPIWEEVAIYGGYRWIELPGYPDIWVSRRWEPYLVSMQDMILQNKIMSCNFECMREFKDMLADNGILLGHFQTYKSFEDATSFKQLLSIVKTPKYAKDIIRIKDSNSAINRLSYAFITRPVVYAIGYSPLLDDLIHKGRVKNVVSDFMGYSCTVRYMNPEDLARLTEDHIVFISENCKEIKSLIRNWANVINFSKES